MRVVQTVCNFSIDKSLLKMQNVLFMKCAKCVFQQQTTLEHD